MENSSEQLQDEESKEIIVLTGTAKVMRRSIPCTCMCDVMCLVSNAIFFLSYDFKIPYE